jgi:hypothetical protein
LNAFYDILRAKGSIEMFQAANIQRLSRTASLAAVNVVLAIGAQAAQAQPAAKPRPQGFATTPAPSSLLLVIAGFAVLLGWRWWRSRAGTLPKTGA